MKGKLEKESEWRKPAPWAPNVVMDIGPKAFVSYNPKPGKLPDGNNFPLVSAVFTSDNSSEETALVMDHKFYILNGDFRKEYSDAFKSGGIEACCRVYAERAEKFGSTWTTASDPQKFLLGMMERLKDVIEEEE